MHKELLPAGIQAELDQSIAKTGLTPQLVRATLMLECLCGRYMTRHPEIVEAWFKKLLDITPSA